MNDGGPDDSIVAKKEGGIEEKFKRGLKIIKALMKFPKDRKEEIDILREALNEILNNNRH